MKTAFFLKKQYRLKAISRCLAVILLLPPLLFFAFFCGLAEEPDLKEKVSSTSLVEAESDGSVYVIPIEGPIEKALLYVIRRGLKQAAAEKARAVVLLMNTPGGQLDATEEIIHLLLRTPVPTYTLVEARALSAGAIIAMATDKIYMMPGSVIGDALPIMITPFGGAQEMPEAMQEKAVSAVSAIIRSAAQQKGHDPKLAEAMVRREIEYKIGDHLLSPAGQLLTLTDVEAAQLSGAENKPLLSAGTVSGLDELLASSQLHPVKTIVLEVTSAEKLARWIETISVLLLAGGLLGIYIEFKTPGFGLPGIAGILCLGLFFWGHHIAGLAGIGEILLFLVGLSFLLVEIFVTPGFGLLGIGGILLILFAFFAAMTPNLSDFTWQTFPKVAWKVSFIKSMTAVVLCGFGAWLLGSLLPRSSFFQRIVLQAATKQEEGYTAGPASQKWLGAEGEAISDLRPSGTGLFEGKRLNVLTRGEYIPAGSLIKVVETYGARIIVEILEKTSG